MTLVKDATELDATERQHVHRPRHRRERLAARHMIEAAKPAKSMRVVREVDAHAVVFGSDRSIAVLAPRIVRTIPPPGIEVQGTLRLWSKVSHGRTIAGPGKVFSMHCETELNPAQSMRK